MTDVIISIFRSLGFVVLYAIIGFGPGLMLGVITANLTGGRGRPPLNNKHQEAIRAAAQHNAQWHPSHKRWQK